MLFESRILSLVCLCPDLFFTVGPSHPGGERHQRWCPWYPFSSCLWSLFLSQLRVAFAVSFPTYEARAKAARWVLWLWGGWHFPREVGGSENDSPGGTPTCDSPRLLLGRVCKNGPTLQTRGKIPGFPPWKTLKDLPRGEDSPPEQGPSFHDALPVPSPPLAPRVSSCRKSTHRRPRLLSLQRSVHWSQQSHHL